MWPRHASESLGVSRLLLEQTRRVRRGSWLPVLLFGIVTIASAPLYRVHLGCGRYGQLCVEPRLGRSFNAFSSVYPLASPGRWLSIYWVVATLGVYGLTVVYYRRRSIATGLRGRTWPTVGTGAILLAVILMAAGWLSGWPVSIGDFGTEPLAVIAISLLVLAGTERSGRMAVFATGCVVLVGFSLFYNDVDALRRLGLAGPFKGSASLFPNLLVPGVYLLIGGILFWNATRRSAIVEGEPRD